MVSIRPARASDGPAIVANDRRAFAASGEAPAALLEQFHRHLGTEAVVVADDRGSIVGNVGVWGFEMALPGGRDVPVAGLTWVAVASTHRRRGLLRRMMDRAVDDARAEGRSAMILFASEGGIYGRVGFGAAAQQRLVQIDARRATMTGGVDPSGSVEFVDDDEVGSVLAPVFERWRTGRPGQIARSTSTWERMLDPDKRPPLFSVVHRDPRGRADGFARYRVDNDWADGHPAFVLHVEDMVACTADAHAALWRHVLSVDLVGSVHSWVVPVDDPLPHLLTDARLVRTREVNDNLWVRVLDVARVFGDRAYDVDDEVVVEVVSSDEPVAGRWLIAGGPDGGSATRTRRRADLTVSGSVLGAISLGGVSPVVLARAGLVTERRPGVAASAWRFLRCDPAPTCSTHF